MSDQFIGEIRIFAGNFAPREWALCNGQLLPLAQNTALFSLLGTNYGGNGKSTFALPDLRGSAPLDFGQATGLSNYPIGDTGGSQNVTLNTTQIPAHTHLVKAVSANGTSQNPTGNAWAKVASGRGALNLYGTTANVIMSPNATLAVGSNLPHNNMPPYLVLTFIIALTGIFPSRQ